MSQESSNCDEDVDFIKLTVSDSLIINRMKIDDIPAFYGYRSNEEVARYQSWSNFTMEDASAFVESQVNRNPNVPGQWIQLAIRNSETSDLLGDCAFCSDEDQPEIVHIGVTIAPDQHCKGLALRALRALLDYLFVTLRKLRVVATVDARNMASLRLFRKLQFREEGFFVDNVFFKGEWGSEVQFALLRSSSGGGGSSSSSSGSSSTAHNISTTASATTTSATISTTASATTINSSLLQS